MATALAKGSNQHPPPGTPAADLMRDLFIAQMLAICGDVRFFMVPNLSDTTTTTDVSRHAHTITWSESLASFDTPPSALGSGVAINFNGTDEEGDVSDNDLFSWGDGAHDQPFSIVSLINPVDATSFHILTKVDNTGDDDEWELHLGTADKLAGVLWDDSAASSIAAQHDAAFTEGAWATAAMTYDGSRDKYGIRIYTNAVRVDNARPSIGSTYVATQNEGETLAIAHKHLGGSDSGFANGGIATIMMCGKQLSQDELIAIDSYMNAFYDLTL
jgi:hypothetical protein